MIKRFLRSVRFLITRKDNQIQKIIKNDKNYKKFIISKYFKKEALEWKEKKSKI